jgi:hypothetical protein
MFRRRISIVRVPRFAVFLFCSPLSSPQMSLRHFQWCNPTLSLPGTLTKIDYYIESFFSDKSFVSSSSATELSPSVFRPSSPHFVTENLIPGPLQTRLPQISFHDFWPEMQADLFVGPAHQNRLFWFFSDYIIESFSLRTTRKFLFRFFFLWGFLPLLPRQDSGHKLSIGLVLKKWICSLTRLVIIWSAVTCHRFL